MSNFNLPGSTLANTWTAQAGQTGVIKVPIRTRGHGNYILVTSAPISEANVYWQFRGREGLGTQFRRSGHPRPNILVWHLDRHKVADSFVVNLKTGTGASRIQCWLYTAPFGTRLPSGPGWQPEDIGTHAH